ncbi:DNA primase [Methylomicrobium sp. Wu6]|uniref:DNA primase n=1 Tax=Methylomicrobium sp. Wu6 TaxID=3107928 RepID=UPI002DD63EA0|nr:DNA primase [Methylomicrobium sp. Wu6]MEC4749336.1 DNA primase [Methylomicrobium sp. Wu6]
MSEGHIPRQFIDDLLVRVDIVDLIDAHLPLKKTGANFVARCPFHTEKTPSFSVNRDKQFYYCFGCGASGNAITFLMEFNRLDFVEAVEDLAAFVGVDIPRESVSERSSPQKKDDLNTLYQLMEKVTAFFTEQLHAKEGAVARDYLRARGVGEQVMRDYRLGYAPDAWQALSGQFNKQALLDTGLSIKNETGHVYDRFRGRIMFPIRDKRGRIVGFGGRVLDDSTPKYLNSPETPLFHKGREVYGLYELLKKNSKPARILFVEGYMDVIALAEFGIDNAVAALGTAASQAHVELLFRFSAELVFCFDGDRAGREAAWRAMDAVFPCLRDGRQVRIMLLPQDEDPDSLVRKEGVERFGARMREADVLSDYFFAEASKDLQLTSIEARAQLFGKVRPYLEKLPAGIFRDMMLARLKTLSEASHLDVLQNESTISRSIISPRAKGRITSARMAIALLVQNPELAMCPELQEIDWNTLTFPGVELFRHIVQTLLALKPANSAVLLESYRDSADEKSVKALAFLDLQVSDEDVETVFCDALVKLRIQSAENELERLLSKKVLTPDEKESLRRLYAIISALKK